MDQHLELYERYVKQLNAIEAAYPMTSWGPADGTETPSIAQLLKTKIADLKLETLDPLRGILRQVAVELQDEGIDFFPLTYLGEPDFWTADRGIAVNVPWFLANPTLWRLANRQAQTSYTLEQVTRCIRHEVGHAVCYAWELWKRPDWIATFGDSTAPYLDGPFAADSGSTDYVEYLTGVPDHYAQKHPDEDWAEAFACWLDPGSAWAERYAGWPGALRKLDYVEWLCRNTVAKMQPSSLYPGRPVDYRRLPGTVGEALGAAEGAQPFSGLPGWSEHAELLRREPHAYNAVVLHEAYFDALSGFGAPGADAWPPPLLRGLAVEAWGSWESYLLDLRAAAGSASPGWALTVWDPRAERLRNALVENHASGALAGCSVVLAIDAWEHAYAPDYGTRKDVYLGAVLRNLDWGMVEQRLKAARGPE